VFFRVDIKLFHHHFHEVLLLFLLDDDVLEIENVFELLLLMGESLCAVFDALIGEATTEPFGDRVCRKEKSHLLAAG